MTANPRHPASRQRMAGADHPCERQAQYRLFVGPLQLVPTTPPTVTDRKALMWALPGGGTATTAEVMLLARRRGWKRPAVVEVIVRCRADGGV